RVDCPEGREDLSPWLGGVFVCFHFRRRGIGAALYATGEDEARSRKIETLYLFTLDKQAWFSRRRWTVLGPCVWQQRPGDIMYKQLQTANQAMQPTAPDRMINSVLATTPCRGLSLSR